jgi:hypothetical protein
MAAILKTIGRAIGNTSATAQKRVVIVGTRGSSKTTSLGCLALECDIMSLKDPNFIHFIDERTSGIRQVPSELCQGRFPQPTPPGIIYEADLYLTWKGPLGDKNICLPFCETAGEDMQSLIGPYSTDMYHQNTNYQVAENLNRYICDSNGYVLVVPVSRAHLPGVPQMDEESKDLLTDPDVNIARILQSIYHHKKKSRSPNIEGIAVLLTKYDMIDAVVKSRGMNLYDPEGAKLFLSTYFRQTSGLLKYYGLEKVRFFPMHVQVERTRNAKTGDLDFVKRADGSYVIAVDHDRNLPVFSEQSCEQLLNWIKVTF